MNILIVGAGVAGPTLAYWLLRAGHRPTLVERAPSLRTGGYVVDFWGAGFDVAERMGIVPELMRLGYRMREVRQVDARGDRIASLDPSGLVRGSGGRYVSLARGDLAATIYAALEERVETILGDSVRALYDDAGGVHVTFDSGTQRSFDLVIGTDGLHSRVRELVFGPATAFETYLGFRVAAFDIEGYRPRDPDVAVLYTEVGRQVMRFGMRGDVTMFLFTFLDDGAGGELEPAEQRAALRAAYDGAGWETPAILERMTDARTLYFDRVSQIRMPQWTRGRVALLGDAAACVSLLAGQGSALAMVAAYVLAAELSRAGGDHTRAFAAYESALGPLLASKQKAAAGFASAFAPHSRWQLFVRNLVMRALGLPYVADLVMGRSLNDAIQLPPPPDS